MSANLWALMILKTFSLTARATLYSSVLLFVQGNIKLPTVVENTGLVAYKLCCVFRLLVGKKRIITMQS